MFDLGAVNWLTVIIATVVYFILGGLWFAPFGLQKFWDQGLGFNRPKGWKPSAKYYVVPFSGNLVITIATALLMKAAGVHTLVDALTLSLIVGVGYAAAVTGILAVSPTTPKPGILAGVVGSYHVVGIMVVAMILFWMR